MIHKALITPKALKYVQAHQLEKQFYQSIKAIKTNSGGADLKPRKPKSADIWSFRITKKYRAFCKKDGSSLVVFKIDDHQ